MTQPSHCKPRAERGGKASASRSVFVLQIITIAWMLVEFGGSFVAAREARSLPIAAFGSDSLVELLSAAVVLMQFGKRFRIPPLVAARLAGGLLFLLAGGVVVLAGFAAHYKVVPDRSYLGIGITIAALVVMPVLALLKRHEGNATRNRALAADAVQSATCAYLAI